MRIRDWSSDVCSSDLYRTTGSAHDRGILDRNKGLVRIGQALQQGFVKRLDEAHIDHSCIKRLGGLLRRSGQGAKSQYGAIFALARSEERRVGQELVSTCRSRGGTVH